MIFQPRNEKRSNESKFNEFNGPAQYEPRKTSFENQSFDELIDQIVEAVRDRLILQGVPLPTHTPADLKPILPTAGLSTPEWKKLLNQGADRIGHTGENPFQPHVLQEDVSLAQKIDHTLLKPDATLEDIKRVCEEAKKYHFATVCVNPSYVKITAEFLKGTDVKPIAVVGFPLGAASTATKCFETREAIQAGAQEIDMVINIGALKSSDYQHVLEDIKNVVETAQPYPVKVILETSSLNHNEKVIGCTLSKAAGAAFVKTSTGFGSGGATAEDIELMRKVVGPDMGVKASGGIRTYEDASKMLAAGANRIGASASIAIVTHQKTTDSKTSPEPNKKKSYKNTLY